MLKKIIHYIKENWHVENISLNQVHVHGFRQIINTESKYLN